MCKAKTLRAASTMRQAPTLAVVLCRSRTKSNAWPEALGPSSRFSSRALVTSCGSSGWALALRGQGQGCRPLTVSVCHQRLCGCADGRDACHPSDPAGEALSFVPQWQACPPRGPRRLPTGPVTFEPSAWPFPPALLAPAPATLPDAVPVSLPDLCTSGVLPRKFLRPSSHLVNIHPPFRV